MHALVHSRIPPQRMESRVQAVNPVNLVWGLPYLVQAVEQQLEGSVGLPSEDHLGTEEDHPARADSGLGHRHGSFQTFLAPGPSAGERRAVREPGDSLDVAVQAEYRAGIEKEIRLRFHPERQRICRIHGGSQERSGNIEVLAGNPGQRIVHRYSKQFRERRRTAYGDQRSSVLYELLERGHGLLFGDLSQPCAVFGWNTRCLRLRSAASLHKRAIGEYQGVVMGVEISAV